MVNNSTYHRMAWSLMHCTACACLNLIFLAFPINYFQFLSAAPHDSTTILTMWWRKPWWIRWHTTWNYRLLNSHFIEYVCTVYYMYITQCTNASPLGLKNLSYVILWFFGFLRSNWSCTAFAYGYGWLFQCPLLENLLTHHYTCTVTLETYVSLWSCIMIFLAKITNY
jgi:hypothetical protein